MSIRGVPPGVNDPNLRGFLNDVRNALAGVSERVTSLSTQVSASSGGGGTPTPTPTPSPTPTPTPGGGPLVPPTSLTVIPSSFFINVLWTNPPITDFAATEIWARRTFPAWDATYIYQPNAKVLYSGVVYNSVQVNNKGNTPGVTAALTYWVATDLSTTEKVKVGETAALSFQHTGLNPGETWSYWVRNRLSTGETSAFFPNDDVGITTTTIIDPGAYLGLLTGAITETQLYSDLGSRINLIDGPDSLIGSVNARVKLAYDALDLSISNIKDGTTDITVKTDTGYSSLRALKTSTETSTAAIVQINDVSATSTSASAKALYGLKGQVNDPKTGLAAAQGYIVQLNTIDVTSTSANASTLAGLKAQVNDPTTGLPQAVANIGEINNVSATSKSAAAQKIASLDATMNVGPDSLSGKILALNDVSSTSTSANARALAQTQASLGKKISVLFQATAPSSTDRVIGDLWYDTANDNKAYRWDGSSWVVYRTSVKTYAQTTAPTSTSTSPLYVGDLWTDISLDSAGKAKNTPYRWDGASWQNINNGLSETQTRALITDNNNAKIGYATLNGTSPAQTFDGNGTIKDRDSATAWNNANPSQQVTWNVGLPLATATKQVSVKTPGVCVINGSIAGYTDATSCKAAGGVWTAGNDNGTSLEQQFIAQQQTNGRLYSQYTVRIDTNGWVSGFGLASSEQSDGTVISDFGIRADRFWIAPPNTPYNAKGGPGIALVDIGYGSRQVVRIEYIYANYYGTPTTFGIAYVQVDGSSGQSLKYLSGLDDYNPFATLINPNNNRWVTLRNVRSEVSGTPRNEWNQSFTPVAAGNFYWTDYRNGSTVYASSLPGVTDASRLIVVAVNSGLPTSSPGYTVSTTDTTNDPAKVVADSLLPFVVVTTDRTYNGVPMPKGVYMNSAFIIDASITNAKIYGDIRSIDYNGAEAGGTGTGTTGWCINKLGNAVFNQVIIRDPSKTILPGVMSQADGHTFTEVTPTANGQWHDFTEYWDYKPTTKNPSYVTLLITFSTQCQMLLHGLRYTIELPGGDQTITLYDDQTTGTGGDLNARAISGSKAVRLQVPSWNYFRFKVSYKVRDPYPDSPQKFQNTNISVLETYG